MPVLPRGGDELEREGQRSSRRVCQNTAGTKYNLLQRRRLITSFVSLSETTGGLLEQAAEDASVQELPCHSEHHTEHITCYF